MREAGAFELVASVSADRRPDLRDAILDGSFQREACPSCGSTFRVDPEFTYLDIARGQYIAVWPVAKRDQCHACVERSQASFDNAFGKGATRAAAQIGKKVDPRVVFGWPALLEKLLAQQAGIDDRTLEIARWRCSQRDRPALPAARARRWARARRPMLAGANRGAEQRGTARAADVSARARPTRRHGGGRDDLAKAGGVDASGDAVTYR